MPELEWLELARTDLLGIVDYISDDNPDAAQRVAVLLALDLRHRARPHHRHARAAEVGAAAGVAAVVAEVDVALSVN